MQVCVGLGIIAATAMAHGVMPELRTKLRNPAKRSDDEKQLSKTADIKRFRAQLRKQFATDGGDGDGVAQFEGAQRPGLDRPAPALGAPARPGPAS